MFLVSYQKDSAKNGFMKKQLPCQKRGKGMYLKANIEDFLGADRKPPCRTACMENVIRYTLG
jgi:hypothetical protein